MLPSARKPTTITHLGLAKALVTARHRVVTVYAGSEMSENLTLEDELGARAGKDPDAEAFWNRYSSMKDYLATQYYPWIQATCPFFTDHGELHINSVIRAASLLLEPHLGSRRRSQLSSLDIFLLLASILWHDVGNALGRVRHAERITEMTNEVRSLGFPNLGIHRLVCEIASAHAGEDGLSKPRAQEDSSTPRRTYTVYPTALAALLRFADEISEDQSRISHALLQKVPDENRIFWSTPTASLHPCPIPVASACV